MDPSEKFEEEEPITARHPDELIEAYFALERETLPYLPIEKRELGIDDEADDLDWESP
jgi:hypothetical protein